MAERTITLHAKTTSDGRGMLEAARDLEKTADAVDDLGGSMQVASRDAKRLDAEMGQLQTRIRNLQRQYAATGDRSIFRDIAAAESDLRRVSRVSSALRPGQPGGGLGGIVGAVPRIGGVPGPVIAGGVAVAAMLTPVVGAAIGGAVIGAVGTGGIIGGIAAASRDAGVQAAARDFGAFVSQEFFSAGTAFVQPTKNALGILKSGFADLDLEESFARVAPSVERVAKGFADFGRNVMPGFNKGLDAAGPILGVLADELPQIGDALGDMISDIADSEGTLAGFHAALDAVEGILRGTGATLGFLSDRWRDWVTFNVAAGTMLEKSFGWVPFIGDRIKEGTQHNRDWLDSMTGAGQGAEDTAVKVNSFADQLAAAQANVEALNASLRDMFGEELGVDKSLIAMKKGVFDLTEALGKNRGAWSLDTEAGLAHREAVIGAIEDAVRYRDALRANGTSAADANLAYQRQIEKIIELGVQAGITRKEMEKLAGKYEVSIMVSTQLPRGVKFTGTYALEGEFRNLPTRDSGGPVAPGKSYLIGGRPEILTMGSQGGHVTPLPSASRTEVVFGGNTDSAFAAAFMKLVRAGDIVITTGAS